MKIEHTKNIEKPLTLSQLSIGDTFRFVDTAKYSGMVAVVARSNCIDNITMDYCESYFIIFYFHSDSVSLFKFNETKDAEVERVKCKLVVEE